MLTTNHCRRAASVLAPKRGACRAQVASRDGTARHCAGPRRLRRRGRQPPDQPPHAPEPLDPGREPRRHSDADPDSDSDFHADPDPDPDHLPDPDPDPDAHSDTFRDRDPHANPDPTPTDTSTTAPVSDSGSSSVPWWVWLLALAAMVAAVVSIVALRRSGGQRKDWEAGYAEGIAESRWLADSLLPTLIAVPGAAERVGGWTVARPRVVALEARLEGLHATAEDELARTRVHTLRSGRPGRSRDPRRPGGSRHGRGYRLAAGPAGGQAQAR